MHGRAGGTAHRGTFLLPTITITALVVYTRYFERPYRRSVPRIARNPPYRSFKPAISIAVMSLAGPSNFDTILRVLCFGDSIRGKRMEIAVSERARY
ncbi:hypothetical protein F4824DRAFT_273765 [Ustulina deusta]|nr:hypothetical protein F4824DRAFT_273765 [Ustulina deusta]